MAIGTSGSRDMCPHPNSVGTNGIGTCGIGTNGVGTCGIGTYVLEWLSVGLGMDQHIIKIGNGLVYRHSPHVEGYH